MNKPKTTTLNDLSLLGEVLKIEADSQPRFKKTDLPDGGTLYSMQVKWDDLDVKQSTDDPNTIYLDPMTEEQRELQYGARIEPLPTTKRVSLLAKHNNRRY